MTTELLEDRKGGALATLTQKTGTLIKVLAITLVVVAAMLVSSAVITKDATAYQAGCFFSGTQSHLGFTATHYVDYLGQAGEASSGEFAYYHYAYRYGTGNWVPSSEYTYFKQCV